MGNIFYKLEEVFELTKTAFAAIDASYWQKCISHMYKEVEYYIQYDQAYQSTQNVADIIVIDNQTIVSIYLFF